MEICQKGDKLLDEEISKVYKGKKINKGASFITGLRAWSCQLTDRPRLKVLLTRLRSLLAPMSLPTPPWCLRKKKPKPL